MILLIWKKYFRYDDRPLKSVSLKNRIGEVYLKTKQFENAYEFYNAGNDSYQAGDLLGFAKTREIRIS